MPAKRSLDASNLTPTMQPGKAQKKTERSHEENQERAYIAASRRADRSIEARVQSAKAASEIHKKRTGRGFKISEAIVQAEEMYEEEEDDLPRSYSMLAAHLQTNSASMNYRVSAYISNRVAMASMVAGLRQEAWAQNPINKLFAEQFPNANQQAQAMLTNSMYYQPVAGQSSAQQQQGQPDSRATGPTSPTFAVNSPQGEQRFQRDRSQSVASPISSPMDVSTTVFSPHVQSPPPLSPSEAVETTPSTRVTSTFPSPATIMNTNNFAPQSSFTTELPNDVKMMASLDATDPLSSLMMGNPLQQQMFFPDSFSTADLKTGHQLDDSYGHEYFDGHLNPYAQRYDFQSEATTPGPSGNLRSGAVRSRAFEDPQSEAGALGSFVNDDWDEYLNYDQNETDGAGLDYDAE